MKKIVSVLKPFIVEQNIFVYEDGNKIDVILSDLDNFPDVIIDTAKKYDLKIVQLIGSTAFTKGIKAKIEKTELIKYDKNELEIEIMSK